MASRPPSVKAKARTGLLVGGILTFVAGIGFLAATASRDDPRYATRPTVVKIEPTLAPITPTPESAAQGLITFDQFYQIKQGMTMGQVKEILQRPGEQLNAQMIDGATVQVYSFDEPSGNSALIYFADGKVIKATPPLDLKADELQ